MLEPLLLLAQAAIVPPPVPPANEVIVIGQRAEQELAACLARQCPPAQEVEASLRASVEQFAAGRYSVARHTLQRAIDRNGRYAAELPGPVSSLYATLATVAEHEGREDIWKSASRRNVAVLRKHLGPDAPETLIEQIQQADDMIGLKMPGVAEDIYRSVRRRGLDHGQPMIAAGATSRLAWLALMRRRFAEAKQLADDSVAIAGQGQSAMRDLRDVLHARIAMMKGDKGAVDALAARLRQSAKHAPRLLFAPGIPEDGLASVSDNGAVRWADVGYWIRPDGHTAEVEILREEGLQAWRSGILRQVGARRYVPLDTGPADPGLYRIDRFTVRGVFDTAIGSRIMQRVGPSTVHVVDLTETDALSETRRAQSAKTEPQRF